MADEPKTLDQAIDRIKAQNLMINNLVDIIISMNDDRSSLIEECYDNYVSNGVDKID